MVTKTDPTPEPLLSLDDLAKRLPAPDPDARAALVEDHTRDEFVAMGQKIASARVIIDEQRIYSAAFSFWRSATPAQRAMLVGFTPELLAIAVDEAKKLTALANSAAESAQRASQAAAAMGATESEVAAQAAALRDQATSVLRTIAAHDPMWLETVNAAHAYADVGTALAQLADVGAKMLAKKKDALARRAQLHGLSAGYLDELRAAAARMKEAEAAHVGRTRRPVSQGALDFADGVNLHLLAAVVRAFENAHDRDATIPRLAPIATRRLIGRASHKKQPAEPTPAPPPSAA